MNKPLKIPVIIAPIRGQLGHVNNSYLAILSFKDFNQDRYEWWLTHFKSKRPHKKSNRRRQ